MATSSDQSSDPAQPPADGRASTSRFTFIIGAVCAVITLTVLSHVIQLAGRSSGAGAPGVQERAGGPDRSQPPASTRPDEGALYAEAVETFIMPVVTEASGPQPITSEELWGRLGDLEFWSRRVADGRAMNLTPDQLKVLERFETALKAKQATEFPKLRAAYRAHARSTLWADDVDIYGSGRMIEFVSASFASRRNMVEALDIVRKDLTRLRFTQARFRWMRDGEGAQFAIDSPADTAILRPAAE